MTEGSRRQVKSRTVRFAAVVISMLMLSVMLFSTFYVIQESDHDCCGDDCPICFQIDQCLSLLRNIGEGSAAIAITTALMLISGSTVPLLSCLVRPVTPVSFKVRMNH